MADPTLTQEELLKSADSLHSQALFLLEDEIAYASSLRDSRKTAATLIALLVGVGIFKIDVFRQPGQELAIEAWAWWVIRLLVTAAIGFMLAGTYHIYTERGLSKEFEGPGEVPKKGAALSILLLPQAVLQEYQEKSPLDVMRMRTDGIRVAYSRLRDSNRRVRKRIALGVVLVILGLALVLAGFGLYVWTVRVTVRPAITGEVANVQAEQKPTPR